MPTIEIKIEDRPIDSPRQGDRKTNWDEVHAVLKKNFVVAGAMFCLADANNLDGEKVDRDLNYDVTDAEWAQIADFVSRCESDDHANFHEAVVDAIGLNNPTDRYQNWSADRCRSWLMAHVEQDDWPERMDFTEAQWRKMVEEHLAKEKLRKAAGIDNAY